TGGADRLLRPASVVHHTASGLAPGVAAGLAQGVRPAGTVGAVRWSRPAGLGVLPVSAHRRRRAHSHPGLPPARGQAARGSSGTGDELAVAVARGPLGAGCAGIALARSATHARSGGWLPAGSAERALSGPGTATGNGVGPEPLTAWYARLA